MTEILTQLQLNINWTIFSLVISSGYFIRVTPILKKYTTTTKVFIFSFLIVFLYVYFAKIETSTIISSYFIAIGFHSVIIKQFEKIIKKNIVGSRPTDR